MKIKNGYNMMLLLVNLKFMVVLLLVVVFLKNTPIIPISTIPDNWHEYHYYGFDLNHYNDYETGVSTNIDYAIKETFAIQKQLEELIAQYVPSTGD